MTEGTSETQSISCGLDPARAAALHATLGCAGSSPVAGDPLPPFWHQIYFWDPQPPDRLGADSHPKLGIGLIPDLGLHQRMWAGGRLQFYAPLRLGRAATRVSSLETVQEKSGRSGRLAFVTLRHEIRQDGQTCVSEWQDLVYRVPGGTPAMPPEAPTDEDHSRDLSFTKTQLFRYSALTFNGHRIHYDADYARQTEGYAGLVVHGPLLAHLLMAFATELTGALSTFSFRATAPLMDFECATLCWKSPGTMWVRGPNDKLCMTAKAT